MSETIYKLEPNRTMHLRGFDRRGAAAALHHTSGTGFTVSGVFRDPADFAVVMLWDADDYFGHRQTTKYLPDFDFTGMTLDFDVAYSNLQWIESLKYASIDWPYLDYATSDGNSGTIKLRDYITARTGRVNPTKTFTVNASLIDVFNPTWPHSTRYDRVTMSFERYSWDYIVPGSPSVTFAFWNWLGTGFHHTLTIDGTTYTYIQTATDGSADIAAGLATAAGADLNVHIDQFGHELALTPITNDGDTITVSAGPDGNADGTLWRAANPDQVIATWMAAAINGTSWEAGTAVKLSATATGNQFTVTVQPANYGAAADANMCAMFEQHKTSTTTITPSGRTAISGGVDPTTVHVSIPFSTAFGANATKVRQLWLTLAPQLTNGAAYASQEWTAAFANWSITDPSGHRALKIAGPGSVRVESRDDWSRFTGSSWVEEASNQAGGTGWFSGGFAKRANATGDTVTVRYSCQHAHDLYIGTSLYKDRGIVSVSLDGGSATALDCFLWTEPPLVTRRIVRSGVAAGNHTLTITVTGAKHTAAGAWDNASLGTYFYFDYLEAAVLSDVPDPAATYANVMPATDFDTDHGYKMSPQRLVWMLDKLGFRGALDHYLGVFWWNQRVRSGGSFHSATVTFAGWASLAEKSQQLKLQFGGATQGDSAGTYLIRQYLPTDTDASLAQAFADYVNETLIGVWASVAGAVLTITARSPVYDFNFWAFSSSTDGTATFGTMAKTGDLHAGTEGTWLIDDTHTPVLNRGATDWHADLWSEVHAKGWGAVASFSMELVNPPDAPISGHVYAQRYRDGTAVLTDTGFGGLQSTQCTFNATVRDYQKVAFKEMAGLMAAAGLTPWLQFGEFLWWFFPGQTPTDTKGMAFYDVDTNAAAAAGTGLGRQLATFTWPTDDPAVFGYADANFLAARIKAHTDAISAYVKASYPTAKFELLWPYDVNYPTPTAIAGMGGRLNRYVNLPVQFQAKSGSGLDRIKMEGLAFGASERNFTQARETARFPYTSPLTWSKADTAFLFPWFNGGCPWPMEYLLAVNEGSPLVNMWAFDHLCLMSWPIPLPSNSTSAQVF